MLMFMYMRYGMELEEIHLKQEIMRANVEMLTKLCFILFTVHTLHSLDICQFKATNCKSMMINILLYRTMLISKTLTS